MGLHRNREIRVPVDIQVIVKQESADYSLKDRLFLYSLWVKNGFYIFKGFLKKKNVNRDHYVAYKV